MKRITLALLVALVGMFGIVGSAFAAPHWTTEKVTLSQTVVVPVHGGVGRAPSPNSLPFGTSSGFAKYCPNSFGVSECIDVTLELTVYFTYNGSVAYVQSIYPAAFFSGGANGYVSWQGTTNNGAQPPTGYASSGYNEIWHFLAGQNHTSYLRVNFDPKGNWTPETHDDCPTWSGCIT